MVMRSSDLLTVEERKSVEEAVVAAEEKTSGEIVVAIASSSGRYDRAEDLFGLLFALAMLALAWGFTARQAEWAVRPVPPNLVSILTIVAVGFVVGATLATRLPRLARPFAGRRMMEEEVEAAAAALFQSQGIRRTASGTGVLIYISLFERIVRVLPDDAIAEKIPDAEWDEVCRRVVDGLRGNRAAEGLVAAVTLVGEKLAPHFPRAADDDDELPNEVILL
jgi:putative membrane protein